MEQNITLPAAYLEEEKIGRVPGDRVHLHLLSLTCPCKAYKLWNVVIQHEAIPERQIYRKQKNIQAQISTYIPSQPQQKSTKDGNETYLRSLQNRQNSGEIVVWCNLPWDPQTRHLLWYQLLWVWRELFDYFHIRCHRRYEPVDVEYVTKVAVINLNPPVLQL
jgi:hypothetical protein